MAEGSRVDAAARPRGQAARELAALLKVSSALAGSPGLQSVLQTAVESAVEVLDLDSGVIYLLEGDQLFLGAAVPPLPAELPDEHRRARLGDHPHLERSVRQLRPLTIDDARREELSPGERVVVESADLRSAVFAPLAVDGRPLGALIVHTVGRVKQFTAGDVDLCRTISHQISLAVANAHLFEAVQRAGEELAAAYDATLEGWSMALEMRDHHTSGHTVRVAAMVDSLGAAMGLTDQDMVHVHRGALIHDIGKMVVPDAILRKPGPLSDEEWVVMRAHPDAARTMLSEIPYLAPALDIPYCHHERWDGCGYPRGLAGEDIPLSARVFAVVDVFDALVSDRPYRQAWSQDEAVAHIAAQSGRHFDPRVAGAFLASLDGGGSPWAG